MVSRQMLRASQSLEWGTKVIVMPGAKALGDSQKVGYDDLEDYDNCSSLYSYFCMDHPYRVTRTLLVDNRECKPLMQELVIQHVNIIRFHKNIDKMELKRELLEQKCAFKEMNMEARFKMEYYIQYNIKRFSLDDRNFPKFQYMCPNEVDYNLFRNFVYSKSKYFLFLQSLEELQGTTIPSSSKIGPEIFQNRCPCVAAKDKLLGKLLGECNILVSY